MYIHNSLQQVPCSKADIFSNKFISLLDKRVLMKFMKTVMNNEEQAKIISEFGTKPFVEFLTSRNLTPTLQSFILYAIAMVPNDQSIHENHISTKDGLKLMGRYLQALGKYGSTPFLTTLYGTGELSQAFCRLAAVFGATYILRCSATKLLLNEKGSFYGIMSTDGQVLKGKYLVSNLDHLPMYIQSTQRKISRCVCITDKSLEPTDRLLMLVIPPNTFGNPYPINVIQLDGGVCACPKGKYLVHFITRCKDTAENDLKLAVENLLSMPVNSSTAQEGQNKPTILWAAYFNQNIRTPKSEAPPNIVFASDAEEFIDYDLAVQEAKRILHGFYPEEEFIPQVPDPNDIEWVADDNEAIEKAQQTEKQVTGS